MAKGRQGDFPLIGREARLARLEDLEPTLIQSGGPRKPRARKRKQKEDTERTEAPRSQVSDLAQDFLRRLQEEKHGFAGHDFSEHTRAQTGTFAGKVRDPGIASLLGLVVWGAGLLYVGYPFAASIVLLGLLSAFTVFGAFSGILPAWLSVPLIRDLGWSWPHAQILAVSGSIFLLGWWMSIVIPSVMARGDQTTVPPRSKPWRSDLSGLLPILGRYLCGEFWRGHWGVLGFGLSFLAGVASFSLWNQSVPESFRLGFAGAFGVGLAIVLFETGSGFTKTLRELGFLASRKELVESEPKFVLLGSILILTMLGLGLISGPGQAAKRIAQRSAAGLGQQGMTESHRVAKKFLLEWDRFDRWVEDQKRLLR